MLTREKLIEEYIKRQWHIFPLIGKVPLTNTRGHLDAKIGYPISNDQNVGLSCSASGLIVIDIDPRHGGDIAWKKLITSNSKPITPCVSRTGGGGAHIFFKAALGLKGKKEICTGVDIKHNGYVVLPPSIHPDGGSYEWLSFGEPILMPIWLMKLVYLSERKVSTEIEIDNDDVITSKFGKEKLMYYCSKIIAAEPGIYNDTINKCVYMIWRFVAGGEISNSEALEEVMKACEETGNNNSKTANLIKRSAEAGKLQPLTHNNDWQ